MKQCTSCLVDKQLSDFQYRSDTHKYQNQCKQCRQVYVNSYRRNNEDYKCRYNEYRRLDTQYAIMDRLRARVRKMLKANNGHKYAKTIELLGCSFEIFKEHIVG
jgi:hypothetical protein